MDQQITPPSGESSAWIMEQQNWNTAENTPVVLIRKPTASNLSHCLLNPFIYRNIQNVGSLDDLAALLGTPNDWQERCNQVVADGEIILEMDDFRNLPEETAESTIQVRFVGLVVAIATRLLVRIRSDSQNKIIIGGILARYEYDLRSKTDPHFLSSSSGLNLIASEAKTDRTFALGEMWYHHSRGIQTLSALYAFNCPTFLFSQRQWKLFVENTERNAILTFPYNDNPDFTPHVNSSLVQPMGRTFLKAIVICLLSQRVDKPRTRKSSRLQEGPRPKYVSGYDDKGQPIFSLVRVVPPDAVARIEEDIAIQEKKV